MAEEAAQNPPSSARMELILTVIMAFAAVGTAWAGFQSTKWSGVQADSYAVASAKRVQSTQQATLAGQQRIVDIVSFTQWLDALNEESDVDESGQLTSAYQPTKDTLSGFLFERFRAEFEPAVYAWLKTDPVNNPDAPPTPFAMPEYQIAAQAESDRLATMADDAVAEARDANQLADNYVFVAVFFALVLFFAAVAGRTNRPLARNLLLWLAVIGVLAATILMATFPIEL
ncbi:hypothetical protein Rhe02_00220 [Rhizocola hellebori]|uniref:Uncharacterized protein n=1 Tax=Rhizocola hellebori TaxID=1392758 RepID=A0A8J3Q241_9ACTN|nr:hypothetical protein [Rhizocola hellebori]GIH01955.1 hypothetical protein Rhe02_00220 [Rhizocola hellebori]